MRLVPTGPPLVAPRSWWEALGTRAFPGRCVVGVAHTHLRLPPQGYLPANAERRAATLQRKREEYFAFVEHYYDSRNDEGHQDTYRQVGLSSRPSRAPPGGAAGRSVSLRVPLAAALRPRKRAWKQMTALWFPVRQGALLARLGDPEFSPAPKCQSSSGCAAAQLHGALSGSHSRASPYPALPRGAPPPGEGRSLASSPVGWPHPPSLPSAWSGCVAEPGPARLCWRPSSCQLRGLVDVSSPRAGAGRLRGRSAPSGRRRGRRRRMTQGRNASTALQAPSVLAQLLPEPVLTLRHTGGSQAGTAPATQEAGLRQKALAQGADSPPALSPPPPC